MSRPPTPRRGGHSRQASDSRSDNRRTSNPPLNLQHVNTQTTQTTTQSNNQPGTPSRQVTPEPRRTSVNQSNSRILPVRVSFSDEDSQSLNQNNQQVHRIHRSGFDQLYNQSVTQSSNQSNSQSSNHSNSQSVDRLTDLHSPAVVRSDDDESSLSQSGGRSITSPINASLTNQEDQSINQLVDSLTSSSQIVDPLLVQTIYQPVDQPTHENNQSTNETNMRLAGRTSFEQSVNPSINPSVNQIFSQSVGKSSLKSSQTNSRQSSVQFSDDLIEMINSPTNAQSNNQSVNQTNNQTGIQAAVDQSSAQFNNLLRSNQSSNQSISQPIVQPIRSLYDAAIHSSSISQTLTPPLTPHHISLDMSHAVSPPQSVKQSISLSNSPLSRPSDNLTINPSADQSNNQSSNQSKMNLTIDPSSSPVNPFKQPNNQPLNQSIDQSSVLSPDPTSIRSLIAANQSNNPSNNQPHQLSRNLSMIQSVDEYDDSDADEAPGKSPRYRSPNNQTKNELINQAINEQISRQIAQANHLNNPSPAYSSFPSPNQSNNQAIKQSNNQSTKQSINQSINRSPNLSIDQTLSPPVTPCVDGCDLSVTSPVEVTLADLIDAAGPNREYNAHLIDPLPKNRALSQKVGSRSNQSVNQTDNQAVSQYERSAAAVVFNNQSPNAGQNPLSSLTNASNIAAKLRSGAAGQSTNNLRRRFDSKGQSINQSTVSDTETNQSSGFANSQCCSRLRDACITVYDYMVSFDPWLIAIVVICTSISILLYLFNCRNLLDTQSGCIIWLWDNPLYMWFAAIAFLIACYQAATVAESVVLFFFSETSGTRFWRIWLYGSAVEWSGRHLAYFSVLLSLRQQNVFYVTGNVSAILDPLLGIFVMALALQIIKKAILKHIVWKMNQKAFDAKIEQLFFVVDFISLISDKANMLPMEQIAPARTARAASVSQSASSTNTETNHHTLNPRVPASHQKNYGDLLNSVKNWTLGQTQAREILRNTKLAHEAGKALWRNVDVGHRGYVTLQDFQCWFPLDKACRAFYLCLPPLKRAQVNAATGLHDDEDHEDHTSDSALFPRAAVPYSALSLPPSDLLPFFLTKQEFIAAIVQFATDRRKLALELTDWSNMSDILGSIGTIIWVFCCIFIFVAMYSSFTTASLTPLLSFMLSFSFMFGNSAKILLESTVFILVSKPYSLGDRVYVPSHASSDLIVHNIALLNTTFKDALTNKLISIPNSALSVQEVANLTRSKQPCFEIPMELDIDVTSDELTQFQTAITTWMMNGDQKGSWMDRLSLNMTKDALWLKEGKVKMVLRVSHTKSWNEVAKLQTSLRALIQYVSQLTKSMNIRPGRPGVPVKAV